MKSIFVLALTAAIVFGFCGCGRSKNKETTPAATEPPVTTAPVTEPMTDPTIVDPTVTNPALEPNVPDPSVDDNHLVDPTTDSSEGIIPEIKGRIEDRK